MQGPGSLFGCYNLVVGVDLGQKNNPALSLGYLMN
jgi:hypothetical protein